MRSTAGVSVARVAVDLHIVDRLGMEHTGVGRYALAATAALAAARPRWSLVAFTNRTGLLPEGVERRPTPWPTERAAARVAWLHTRSAAEARGLGLDAWVGSAFTLPIWCRLPMLVTIHDLIFATHRSSYSHALNARYATAATRWSARRAGHIVCGANATADELERLWNVPRSKVSVVTYGVDDRFHGLVRSPDAATILYVGTLEPRKGIPQLLSAFARVRERAPQARLLLAGKRGWNVERLMDAVARAKGVTHVDAPSDDALVALYAQATLVVLPSFAEGFGLPVAEAIAAKVPVVCSDLQAIRDWAGEAPTYVPPGDIGALAGALADTLNTPAARVPHGPAPELRWCAVGQAWAVQLEQMLTR